MSKHLRSHQFWEGAATCRSTAGGKTFKILQGGESQAIWQSGEGRNSSLKADDADPTGALRIIPLVSVAGNTVQSRPRRGRDQKHSALLLQPCSQGITVLSGGVSISSCAPTSSRSKLSAVACRGKLQNPRLQSPKFDCGSMLRHSSAAAARLSVQAYVLWEGSSC